jgi:predicted transcriptional regulator
MASRTDGNASRVMGHEIVDGEMVAMDEVRYRAFVQAGLDDLAAGRTVPHEEVMRTMRDKLAHKSAA